MRDVYIVSAKRLPMGSFQGQLTSQTAVQLGAHIISAVIPTGISVDGVLMGCVLQAGLGQAPARQAALGGGLPASTQTATLNKVCGSGMLAVMNAANEIRLGAMQTVIAGGMESMSNAPYLLEKARTGYRMGHGAIIDHMMRDGLEDAHMKDPKGDRMAMGFFAEATAEKYGFSRQDQEDFARHTFEKACAANMEDEIHPITIKLKEEIQIHQDEPLSKVRPDKFAALRPAFLAGGTVTAATSSSIADGASALCLMSGDHAKDYKPLAKIIGYTAFAREPHWFTLAPSGAIEKLCTQIGWNVQDVDLFEINEAFAVVPMAVAKDLNIPMEKLNVRGGACALGHALGSSGARILVTLIHALKERGLQRGIASACIGGGEATAIAIEMC